MRILINAASANMGGAITYLINLLQHLPIIDPDSTFIVYVPDSALLELGKLSLPASVQLTSASRYLNINGQQRLYFDQVIVPRLLGEHKADVLFSSTGFGTLVSPCPQILLVRNSVYFSKEFEHRFQALGHSIRGIKLRRWWSFASIYAANVVLFPTDAMRDLVTNYVTLQKKSTEVIQYGFDRHTFCCDQDIEPDIVKQIGAWKEQGYQILINVASYAIHKNFETVIEALSILKQRNVRIKFLTTLSREKTGDKFEFDQLMQRIKTLDLEESIVQLGYLPYQQLYSIYRASDAFIFPSFTESFGHPLIEAMASGVPVIAADTQVNREICSNAAIYFQTFDRESCADSLISLLNNSADWSCMQQAALQRSLRFSWSQYAKSFMSIANTLC